MELFNQVTLHNVTLDDPEQSPVLQGEYLSAKLEILPLVLHNQIRIHTLALLSTEAQIRKKADGTLNIQYLIDAFSNPNDTTPTKLDLKAGVVIMRHCHITYNDEKGSALLSRGIDLQNVDMNLSVRHLTSDSLSLRLRHCAFKEKSGRELKNMAFKFNAGKKGATLSGLTLELPHSRLQIPEFSATYDTTHGTSLNNILASLMVRPFQLSAEVASEDIIPNKPALYMQTTLQADYARQRLNISNLSLNESATDLVLNLSGSCRLQDRKPHDAHLKIDALQANVPEAARMVQAFSGKELPQVLNNISSVNASGNVSLLDPSHGTAHMNFKTGAGDANIIAQLAGEHITINLESPNLNPATILPGKGLPELIQFKASASTTLQAKALAASTQIQHLIWHGEDYSDINANGTLNGEQFTLYLNSQNALIGLNLTAEGDTKLKTAKVEAELQHLRTLLPKHIMSLAGTMRADIKNLLSTTPTGEIRMQGLTAVALHNDSVVTHHLKNLGITSVPSPHGVNIKMTSDFAQAQFNGEMDIKAIRAAALQVAHTQFPEIAVPEGNYSDSKRWNFAFYLHDTELLQALFKIPIDLKEPLNAEGYLHGNGKMASLQLNAPEVSISGIDLCRLRLHAASQGEKAEALLQAEKPTGKRRVIINVHNGINHGELRTNFQWREVSEGRYYGKVEAYTHFDSDENSHTRINTQFEPSTFAINDTLWHVSQGHLRYCNKRLDINQCRVSSGIDQSLFVDGTYSPNPSDSLTATLHNIDLKYILDLLNFKAVLFEGKASGIAKLKMQEDNKPQATFNLRLPALYFNHTNMGQAEILGNFDANTRRINLTAQMQEAGLSRTNAKGYISIPEKGLDLDFQAMGTPVAFLNYFIPGILEDIDGRATGNVRLYGPFKQLDFEGKVTAQGAFTVPVTGVHYNLTSCAATFKSGLISFEEGIINDGTTGTGSLRGHLEHTHLKNMRYHFQVNFKDALVYDMPQRMDWNFYATARGSGHATLDGRPGRLETNVSFTANRGTDFTFINDTPELVSDGGYVHFGSKRLNTDTIAQNKMVENTTDAPAMDILLNFNINLSPDAALHIIMDEKCGDVINLFGSGAINASWYNKGDFQMYGSCKVDHGEYRFSLQDVIRKNFQLMEGGEVIFSGNPLDANLNVQAIYTVNSASLADLNAGTTFTDNKVRVNCILNIQGTAGNPLITFDLDLPTVNEDEKQMVRKLIATEEDMNMQIIYLLGIGRFYTYDAESQMEGGANMLATNSVNSFLSNTLSSQLNEILTNALHNNNWSFGANLATGNQGWNDMEVAALLSGRLFNNRLLLNGQFGYRDKATMTSNTNFIGDFDIQYLITKHGNVRLKAYNETNDRYFTKTALTTQGIGIMLQHDFGRIVDKVKRKKMKTKGDKK